jgi:hypothetical protein
MAARKAPNAVFCMPCRTSCILLVSVAQRTHEPRPSLPRQHGTAAEKEPNVLFCMSDRTKCILLMSNHSPHHHGPVHEAGDALRVRLRQRAAKDGEVLAEHKRAPAEDRAGPCHDTVACRGATI